jgi:hypothetical protein
MVQLGEICAVYPAKDAQKKKWDKFESVPILNEKVVSWQSGRVAALTNFVIRDLEEDQLSCTERIEESQRPSSYHRAEKADVLS